MRRLCFFIVILTIATFITSNIYANTTYTIKKGDSPYKIAKKFKVKTQDIVKVNNLKPYNLKPGTKITIPLTKDVSHKKDKLTRKKDEGRSHETNKINTPKPSFSKSRHDSQPRGKGGLLEDSPSHTVKKGDTLSFLAKKYSISVNELKGINNLRTTKLKPGQQLIVKKIVPKTYTVRKGDNIWKIAKKFNIDPDKLKDINDIETDLLKPGRKILLQHDVAKNYEAILSQSVRPDSEANIEDEIKKTSEFEAPDLKELGMKKRLILFAKKLLNIPYRFGGNSLLGIDCSAYVQKVYSLIGINLPRSARAQFSEGNPVDKEDLATGDLVFFRTYASFPSHVGIYLGNNLFIHASSRGKKVTIDSLETPYYLKRFIGAKRFIEGEGEETGEPQKEG